MEMETAAPTYSLDGSFTCGAALRRLLDRCPALASHPVLAAVPREVEDLERRGDASVVDGVASALAQPFLHPSYTIPIVGCFRPVCGGIVDRAVALLQQVADGLGSGCGEGGEDAGGSDVEVVEFYMARDCGLRLHEFACLALCRALDLAPFLLGSVLNYFGFSPPPFQRLLTAGPFERFIEKDSYHSLAVVRVCYRLLQMEPNIFSNKWNWSCFLDLVENSAESGVDLSTESLTRNTIDIRWCSVQIISMVLRISDNATSELGLKAEDALQCMLRWEEFCQDTSLEKAGCYFQTVEVGSEGLHDTVLNSTPFHKSAMTGYLVGSPVCPQGYNLRHCQWKKSLDEITSKSPFVLSSAVKKGFEMVLVAVIQKWPVLLYGPEGSGKTAIISKVADIYNSQVIFIHMDEQMDSKTLLGSYVCSERPGEFRWQPGSLTQAVMKGFWVAFEDIDKSPVEVQSILLPLLEGAKSFVTAQGEAISVSESFRLFATVSSSRPDFCHNAEGRMSFSPLWRKVMLGVTSNKDLIEIMNAWYPSLVSLSAKFSDIIEGVNHVLAFQNIGFKNEADLSSISGRFSARHLLKWCKRVSSLGINFSALALSTSDYERIYLEAVDIFASSFSSIGERSNVMRVIAKILGISDDRETLCIPHKPIIQDFHSYLQVGRMTLQHTKQGNDYPTRPFVNPTRPFVNLRTSLITLEKIACSIMYNEPVLLVGETGTGKTTLVQNLATRLGQQVTVLNLSQQSDATDLLGGFKPLDKRSICVHLYDDFLKLFHRTFSMQRNDELIRCCKSYRDKEDWKRLLGAFGKCVNFTLDMFSKHKENGYGSKRKRSEKLPRDWESFSMKLDTVRKQISSPYMSFSFVEGAFITALRRGHWILLDEVNLAPQETLQRIIGVLDGENGTLCLTERGDVDYVARHPYFRIFACMNPATDAGKRDLPHSFRSRFTEYYVDDILDDDDLTLFINQYLEGFANVEVLSKIVQFYKTAKRSEERLQDGANQKPHFSLRSLARALEYTKSAMMRDEKKFGMQRSLYDGFSLLFVTSLDGLSARIMKDVIVSCLLGGMMPHDVPFCNYLDKVNHNASMDNYILTSSVKDHLKNLARAVYIKRYPVLLQGPTSSGKTSLVHYLASITGHKFVRVNNHEHTDLQEYFGSYVTNSHGSLEFQEGVLVEAVRNGYWIVLDELNLAPTDLLEALNRLLDDNRELFVPELQERVPAHRDFMLFATQNPPTIYAGRKMLSRAFRNRFLEIHVDEIPEDELAEILEKRCEVPLSYAKKMVEVMKDLQLHRQRSKIFSGKHGFITPRDLFRWANRFRMFGTSYLAYDGYFLLAERLQDECEKDVVQDILEQRLHVKLESRYINELHKSAGVPDNTLNVVMTRDMQRLYFLVKRCYDLREPVLLVGETGGGKTTVCQLLSAVLGARLHILNCHQYTEASDFIGGFHPVRDRSRLAMEYKSQIDKAKSFQILLNSCQENEISADVQHASSTISFLKNVLYREKELMLHPDVTQEELGSFQLVIDSLLQLHLQWQTIFVWEDGPLVQAMKNGDLFLVDEISLADDSVLERLNSILEPEKTLLLAEKGGSNLEKVSAHPNFFILATMNPGGDYGKKELSPSLRNRFTEIWVPTVSNKEDLRDLASDRFAKSELLFLVQPMLNFWEWFNQMESGRMLTVRDLLSWISFVNLTEENLGDARALLHGAFLILLDGLSLGTSVSKTDVGSLREECFTRILEELKLVNNSNLPYSKLSDMKSFGWVDCKMDADSLCYNCVKSDNLFGIQPFCIEKGRQDCKQGRFEIMAPTTCRNSLRLLRAMQLQRPVLLEGSPGVGKTSLVLALAEFSRHNIVRINLSEQTDMMDLLGSDLPIAGDSGMEFAWSDGILLQALKKGSWVLLDELNLAPQSVLEGLNAILDHRAEVYIPELGTTFKCPSSFRVFACQNPTSQGGGRKCLPKSFLNRFTKVYVDELGPDDYLCICQSLYPSVPRTLISKLIEFNSRLYEDTMLLGKYGQEGSPWEFNLRDVLRACQIIKGASESMKETCFLLTLYIYRMRIEADRKEVLKVYEEIFGKKFRINQTPRIQINPHFLVIGDVYAPRTYFLPTNTSKMQLIVLPSVRKYLEAILQCVQNQWLCILVGASSSGKTSLLQTLAHLTGNSLHEFNLSSGTDVSELLGCFEQYNAFSSFTDVVRQVERYVGEYCALRLQSSWKDFLFERKELIARWLNLLSSISGNHPVSDSHIAVYWRSRYNKILIELAEIIQQLNTDLKNHHLPVSWSHEDLTRSLNVVKDLQKKGKCQASKNFEWVNGRLIKAIEFGEWVVLDNANLCNPTVLDRINSLLEPSGSITVNERGLVDGSPLVVKAHPNFRMFITIDPRYGEISRAMRNRGVEICLIEQNWLHEKCTSCACEELAKTDAKRFLIQMGIPLYKLIKIMSDAHIYARNAGLRVGVSITLLELRRWVELFQQLVFCGNQLSWSLQLSWEHTYLTSFGEVEGKDIVNHVRHCYLSDHEWSPLMGNSLCLPGGWPSSLDIMKCVYFSQETTVKQNCMYLEFLGAQFASHELSICNRNGALMNIKDKLKPVVVPIHLLVQLLFPSGFGVQTIKCPQLSSFEAETAKKMIFICLNWVVEQATGSDIDLYLSWFRWYVQSLHPLCNFIESFLDILEEERAYPIWKCIMDSWRVITRDCRIDVNKQILPLLSYKVVEIAYSSGTPGVCPEQLHNAMHSVGLLRLSLEQWNDESNYIRKNGGSNLISLPVLYALGRLEKEVIGVIDKSSCFEHVFDIYSNLLEHHRSFWKYTISSDFKYLLIAWHFLEKQALKLREFFPVATGNLMELGMNLTRNSTWKLGILKPMLWKHGGHPYPPLSASVFHNKRQLSALCADIWPRRKLQDVSFEDIHLVIDAILSANSDLRHLAVQGICLSTFSKRIGHDNDEIADHLEEIYQGLSKRVKHERNNLKKILMPALEDASPPVTRTLSTVCCMFSLDILHSLPGLCCWLESLLLFDRNSLFLDIKLIQELSRVCSLDSDEPFNETKILDLRDLLQCVLDYSIKYSSRPPTDFLAHQNILWLLNAWSSVDSVLVLTELTNFVHEMWFNWHSSLWYYHYPQRPLGDNETCLLLQPIRFVVLDTILSSEGMHEICRYDAYHFKIRVLTRNLCPYSSPDKDVFKYLLAGAHYLFQQIIFAHRKCYEELKFQEIKDHLRDNKGNLQSLKSLILSSSHYVLNSCVGPVLDPLIKELYSGHPHDSVYNLGLAWMHLGLLRFHLLLNSMSQDPSIKYSFKLNQITERISMLELEIKVRQECVLLAGGHLPEGEQDERMKLLERLKDEKRQLEGKIVFRPDPADFDKLKNDSDEFLGSELKIPFNLMDINEVQNWQAKSAQFICQLSERFTSYVDIIQPIQVAVYEMKLGAALLESSLFEKKYLLKVNKRRNVVLDDVFSLMQFPLCFLTYVDFESNNIEFKSPDVIDASKIFSFDWSALERLILYPTSSEPDKDKLYFRKMVLANVAYYVSTSMVMDRASFFMLIKVFGLFGNSMKSQMQINKDLEDRNFKFRPRGIRIQDILKMDSSAQSEIDFGDNCASVFEGKLMEEHFVEQNKLGDESDLIPEVILKSLVHIHSQVFGASNLYEYPSIIKVTNEEKLHLFLCSYELGTGIIKGLPTTMAAELDEKVVVEQMFRSCLESEGNMIFFQQHANKFNIYKDPNALVMSKMAGPLLTLQGRIKFLLNDWSDHPVLLSILDATERLLSIPFNSPLLKALFGLEMLLARAHFLQETSPKLSLSGYLEPLYSLIYSWQKIELDSWLFLLDGVEEQYEINAGKLWFPLYSVLHPELSGDAGKDNILTAQWLEDFMQTSNLGEFKMRLQLLLAFYGQFSTAASFGICLCSDQKETLNICSCSHQKQTLNILYNALGYYMQFLPLVMKHVNAERRCIEEEIKNHMKILKWEHPNTFLSIKRFGVARQKFWKFVQKYSDVLHQSLMVVINQVTNIKNSKVWAWKQKPSVEEGKEPVPFSVEQKHFGSTERLLKCHGWYEKIKSAFEASFISWSLREPACPISLTQFTKCEELFAASGKGWASIGKIHSHAVDFIRSWKYSSKGLNKRRSLNDLMKILEGSGLSRHRTNSKLLNNVLLQSAYDVRHLLMQDDDSFNGDLNNQVLNSSNSDLKWKLANRYYFKNIAILQQLLQSHSNFHKDLSLELVNRAISFVDHLIIVQQDQRSSLYAIWEQFKKLRWHSSLLETRGCNDLLSPNQNMLFQCTWKQKKLFDMLVTLSLDMSLLLRCIGNSHLSSCHFLKADIGIISAFINEHIQTFVESKELLDKYLLPEGGIVAASLSKTPFLLSKQMEVLVMKNFQIISSFDSDIQSFMQLKISTGSVPGLLLNRFTELISKGKLIEKEFLSSLACRSCSTTSFPAAAIYKETLVELDASFNKHYRETTNLLHNSVSSLGSLCMDHASIEHADTGKITSWSAIFNKYGLHLELTYNSFCETVVSASKLLNHTRNDLEVYTKVQEQLSQLLLLLDLFLNIGEAINFDFLAVHNVVAEMTNMLGQIFALLFSEGFGDLEEPVDDTDHTPQDAKGTGMGEGEGLNDVSDQIDDEGQLLGTLGKESQVPENSEAIPSKNDKGIEMEDNFGADVFSLSEDSGDDGSENEDANIESVMGQNVDHSQIIDEKLWDKEEDTMAEMDAEKYELGSSIKDRDPSCRELRGKEDTVSGINENGELTEEEFERLSMQSEDPDASDDEDLSIEAKMDEITPFDEPSGIQCDEQKQASEEASIDNSEDMIMLDEKIDEAMANESSELKSAEDQMDVDELSEVEKSKGDEGENADDTRTDMTGISHEPIDSEQMQLSSLGNASVEPVHDKLAADSNSMPEPLLFNNHDTQKCSFLSGGLPSGVSMDESPLPDLSQGDMFTVDKPKIQSAADDHSSFQKITTNPYRSIGDALKEWKDRVKISDKSREHHSDLSDVADDGDGDEYTFISEMEKGSSQTLGSATSEQIIQAINRKDTMVEEHINKEGDNELVEFMNEDHEKEHIRSETSLNGRKLDDQASVQPHDTTDKTNATAEDVGQDDLANGLVNFAPFQSSFMCEEQLEPQKLTADQSRQGEHGSFADWRRYERLTLKLSQELCEQLRMVMEPTVASKLQGDYKTGKRINMKKIIPYIASHFRKDKIWLRRTRPNKRDYQVAIAIDDSRSMSESNFGGFALEALITVCRAMSQLEVGQFSVTSFGEKGNVKLIHPFDQPFTGESGSRLISSLSFAQDNTVRDEPMADLLEYVDKMLDTAVARARPPSGINPLKQLVLIIADGRFQDKERVKRRAREILTKKRMVAFVLLDNRHESVMELPEYSFAGGRFSCTRYMDSFPFPYYVVLRDIEALPRTVADLVRQWFQLVLGARE